MRHFNWIFAVALIIAMGALSTLRFTNELPPELPDLPDPPAAPVIMAAPKPLEVDLQLLTTDDEPVARDIPVSTPLRTRITFRLPPNTQQTDVVQVQILQHRREGQSVVYDSRSGHTMRHKTDGQYAQLDLKTPPVPGDYVVTALCGNSQLATVPLTVVSRE